MNFEEEVLMWANTLVRSFMLKNGWTLDTAQEEVIELMTDIIDDSDAD